jgi:excinuclease ABC subunit A
MAVRICGKNLLDILQLTVDQATDLYRNLALELDETERELSRMALDDVRRRLGFVTEIGLGHLTLLRAARTLSGGQIRRLLLASAIGSRITGTLCVVDEPSAGLLPDEVPLVLRALRQLLDQRNSVIAVDHNPIIIREADHVIDLGPGAGPRGGRVMFAGSPDQVLDVEDSSTGHALLAERNSLPGVRSIRQPTDWLTLNDIQYRNLRDLTVRFPLGVLCVVSGPGGSGKSSLVTDVLVPCLRDRLEPSGDSPSRNRCRQATGGDSLADVVIVDRAPLTRSSRSNAATWLEVFDDIRDVFAMTADAKQRGFGIQQFSFNAAQGGRCRACRGTGVLRHDMHFLPDVTLTCPECVGTRFRREILDVKYRGRSIADVLAMSASEAATFFRNHPRLQGRLQMLKQIGLDYLVLGQPTDTLSGGEAQRLKLAARLTSSRGPTLIVCDDATVGLHPADVTRLVACFDELLGIGHSIVVIDNSNELRREADYLIDVGPGAGDNGGRIVFEGPRAAVVKHSEQRRI